MQNTLENKVVLITGGTRGIGRSTVLAALNKGARVVYCGRETMKLEKLQVELNELGFGDRVLAVTADISKEDNVKKLFDMAHQRFSSVDIVINNAIIIRDYLLTFMPNEAWHDVLDVNLTGAFLVSKYAIQTFVRQGSGGKILSLGSIVQNGSPSAVAYSTSKGGLVGLTKSIAHEFKNKGIAANLVSFGYVDTELMSTYPEVVMNSIKELCPLKRAASMTEAAEVLVFFASMPTSLFNGRCVNVSGGLNDIPALSFSRLLIDSTS